MNKEQYEKAMALLASIEAGWNKFFSELEMLKIAEEFGEDTPPYIEAREAFEKALSDLSTARENLKKVMPEYNMK